MTMYCVNTQQVVEQTLSKSRFIGVLVSCATEREVLSALKGLHGEHLGATHIAYAYRLKTESGLVYRFHDAGEPTGTAGKPIFQHVEGKDLVNVLLAVIRYFGGIKLGAGGLTRAYGNTAKLAIAAADCQPYVERVTVSLQLDYAKMQALAYLLKKLDGHIVQQDFAAQIQLSVQLPAAQLADLCAAFPEVRV